MAGRSGNVRTVGYLTQDGKHVMFAKAEMPTEGKKLVSFYRAAWDKAVARWSDGSWDDVLDSFIFADVKVAMETA